MKKSDLIKKIFFLTDWPSSIVRSLRSLPIGRLLVIYFLVLAKESLICSQEAKKILEKKKNNNK